MSHYGELQTYRNDCAFADALQCVINVVFKGREYPVSRWRYILHAAKKENGVALKGSESILKNVRYFLGIGTEWRINGAIGDNL